MTTKHVLDASALLAYLSDESGAAVIEEHLQTATCMSAVNWGEIVSKTFDQGKNPDQLDVLLKRRGSTGGKIQIYPFILEDARTIGQLRLVTKNLGLSLGDRACLALALRLDIPVLTADRSWMNLTFPLEIKVIR